MSKVRQNLINDIQNILNNFQRYIDEVNGLDAVLEDLLDILDELKASSVLPDDIFEKLKKIKFPRKPSKMAEGYSEYKDVLWKQRIDEKYPDALVSSLEYSYDELKTYHNIIYKLALELDEQMNIWKQNDKRQN